MKISLILTLFFSWAVAAAAVYFRKSGVLISLTSAAMVWIPGLIGLLFAKKEAIQFPLFKSPGWALLALAILFPSFCTSFAVYKMLPPNLLQFPAMVPIVLAIGLLGSLLGALLLLGQEIYWRGYLHEKLKNHGMLKASIWIGLFWGAQQSALFYAQDPSMKGLVQLLCLNLAVAPVLFWIREKGYSVLSTSFALLFLNTALFCANIVFKGSELLLVGRYGAIWILAFALLSTLLIYREKAHAR